MAKRVSEPKERPVVLPVQAKRFMPSVGDFLTVQLPGEVMRCTVEEVVTDDRVRIEISSVPMSRAHSYRLGDKTGAERRRNEQGAEIWEASDDRRWIAEMGRG